MDIPKLNIPDAIKVLISLVEIAQKRGTYTIDEAYLAFNAIHPFINDKKYDDALQFIHEKHSKPN